MAPRAGLLVKRGGERLFLAASIVRQLVPLPRLSKMPWDCAQMALVAGEIVAVVELAPPSGVLVLCEHAGQTLALSGLHAEQVGFWPATSAGVRVNGADVPALDLGLALAEFQATHHLNKDGAP
ncbi:MAG: hypothetical protein ABJB12_07040 [Pseudomonadota bacterium]